MTEERCIVRDGKPVAHVWPEGAKAGDPCYCGERTKAGSGIDPETGEWTPAMEGQRPPFEEGNQLAVTHGAKSVIRMTARADEILVGLRRIVPSYQESDEPALRRLALVYARIEAVNTWIEENGLFKVGPRSPKGSPWPILASLSAWETTAGRMENAFGLTPLARAALKLEQGPPDPAGLEEGRKLAERRRLELVQGEAAEEPDEDDPAA